MKKLKISIMRKCLSINRKYWFPYNLEEKGFENMKNTF